MKSVLLIAVLVLSSFFAAEATESSSFMGWCQSYENGTMSPSQARTMYSVMARVYFRRSSERSDFENRRLSSCGATRERLADKYSLNLYESRISDLTPLESLVEFKQLKELRLDNNGLRSVEGLGQLTQLEVLRLDENSIYDISPLASLVNLRDLDLSESHVSDFTPLSSMVSLERLNLSYVGITDVAPVVEALKNLPNLQEVKLMANDFTDATPLDVLRAQGVEVSVDKAEMCSNISRGTSKWIRELCREYICEEIDEDKKWQVEFCASEPVDPRERRFGNNN
jgi:Leucine-rich repeat (LRR) protein